MWGPSNRPSIVLRYGIPRDKQLIKLFASKRLIDALLVPGNILAHQMKATPAAVRWLELPYVVDPMSYLFCNSEWCRPGGMRDSVAKLLETLGERARQVCSEEKRALRPQDLTPTLCQEMASSAVSFQNQAVAQTTAKSIDRYFKFLKKDAPLPPGRPPERVVAPYFPLESRLPWLDANLRLIRETADAARGAVAAVLFFDQRLLVSRSSLLEQALPKYEQSEADVVFVWPDGFEDDFGEDQVGPAIELASLVRRLSSAGKHVFFLYGGYFALLLRAVGLGGVSHGIFYTQHRSADAAGLPSGPPPVRYYFPEMHQFRTIAQAARILAEAGSRLPCHCDVCTRVLEGQPGNIARFLQDPALAKAHFAQARVREALAVATMDPASLKRQLLDAFALWDPVVTRLVNPDSRSGSLMSGVSHLKAWAAVIDSFGAA